ncbi:hypothetical protein BAE44_0022757 [Dichanthelium oligosanthes]|uniref:DUF569 domain-containing protein n=1 Tax=Dichanthelium oligosanthes TaxID=888268 RepID=A0A1E5UTS3_9POAL|nr:hypothetical protein BAE44_0022757 [Dichanthelium oligosanthes]
MADSDSGAAGEAPPVGTEEAPMRIMQQDNAGTGNQEATRVALASQSLGSSAAMEVFKGSEFVRLRSLEHGTYLHAAEDGRGICLDAHGASRHAAWAVQWEQSVGGRGRGSPCSRGTCRFLLHGVYGRYLGAPDPSGPLLHPYHRRAAAQRDRDDREGRAIM